MGMFDTIYFDKPYLCPNCRAKIESGQVKEFECILAYYHVKDCVSHAEDIRIVKSGLFCDKCSKFTGHVYIAVFRGILVGVADSLRAARDMVNDMNLEKLILWYHDLCKKYYGEVRENKDVLRFLRNVVDWFEQDRHKKKKDKVTGRGDLPLIFDKEYLKGSKDPLEAIKRFLAVKKEEEKERTYSNDQE
jgi:hypothetical protein